MTQEIIVYSIMAGVVIYVGYRIYKAFNDPKKKNCDNCVTGCTEHPHK